MKKLFLFFLLSIFTVINSQDFQISSMNGYSVDFPHVALGGNYSNIIFGNNFYYYRFDVDGPTSGNVEALEPVDNYSPITTDIAVDPDDPNHIAIAYNDFSPDYISGVAFYACYITESLDGGATWDTPTLLDTIQLGNRIYDLLYNVPRVEFMYGSPTILWRVHSNSVDTNAIYIGSRYGARNRVDDPSNSDMELAIGLTVEDHNGVWWTAVSYGKEVDGHVMFYLCHSQTGLPSYEYAILVKDNEPSSLNIDHLTKAFVNEFGTMKYIYSDFSHSPQVVTSEDWGTTWTDAGTAASQMAIYIAFERTAPDYYVKLFLDNNSDLVYYVSKDLLAWQYAGKLNSDESAVEAFASAFVDIKCDPDNKFIVSTWRDTRTGNSEIFYGKAPLPEITDVQNEEELAKEFVLYQNYPNPFNPITTIKFTVPENIKHERQDVWLSVYDVLGRAVKTLVDQKLQPGNHKVNFDASYLSSGMYFYRIDVGNKFSLIKKMILLK